MGLTSGWGRAPEEGNGDPLQSSCLENPMDRGAWWATVHGVTKSWTRLSDFRRNIYIKQSLNSFLVVNPIYQISLLVEANYIYF